MIYENTCYNLKAHSQVYDSHEIHCYIKPNLHSILREYNAKSILLSAYFNFYNGLNLNNIIESISTVYKSFILSPLVFPYYNSVGVKHSVL